MKPNKRPDVNPSKPRSAARRSFMRAVGAGFAAFPFYRLVEDHFAKAAGDTPPLRFIGVYHPHGIAAEYFVMQSTDTTTNFDLTFANCSLLPLNPYKSNIVAIEGIDNLSNANGHDSAGTIFTGSQIDSSAKKPQNSSIDQFLAVEKGLGSSTPVTSIQLSVGDVETESGKTLSYSQGGIALPKILDPVQAFNTLFGNFVAPNDPAAQAAALRQQQLGQSVYNFVYPQVQSLYSRLGTEEQQKLLVHLDALNDLEKQFTSNGMTGGPSCTQPAKPDSTQFPSTVGGWNSGASQYFDFITKAHITLLAQAIACDVTRFATFYMSDLGFAANMLGLGLPADNHSNVAHSYSGSPVGSDGHPVGAGDPATWLKLATFNKYSYGNIALLMQQLSTLGVLDDTLICASSDMGNPALHSVQNVPTLLAGGAHGAFAMGRRLKMKPDCLPNTDVWCSVNQDPADYTPVATGHLMVSIANAFGVAVNTFGTQPNAADITGPLPML